MGEDIKQGTAPKSSRKRHSSHGCVQGPSPHSKLLLGMTFSHPGQAGGGGASWLPNVNIRVLHASCGLSASFPSRSQQAFIKFILMSSVWGSHLLPIGTLTAHMPCLKFKICQRRLFAYSCGSQTQILRSHSQEAGCREEPRAWIQGRGLEGRTQHRGVLSLKEGLR